MISPLRLHKGTLLGFLRMMVCSFSWLTLGLVLPKTVNWDKRKRRTKAGVTKTQKKI